jgi:hypothetical protein
MELIGPAMLNGAPPKHNDMQCVAYVPTKHSWHIDIQHFAIQDWKDAGDIIMTFIPGILNPLDDLIKPLGRVLHECHVHRIMGHY